MSRLELDDSGRIISPDGAFSITYNSPWPTVDGTFAGFAEPANGMVVHTEVGYEHSVIDEFSNLAAQASAFCSIAGGWSPGIADGHIHQFGPIGKGWMAWTQRNGNPKWRGVEHEDGGDETRPLTTLQICSSAALLELFSRVDGFPIQATDDPSGRGLIFHVDGGAAWGGHDCPGAVRQAQRPTILYLAALCRNPPSAPPTPQGAPKMEFTDLGSGALIAVDENGDIFARPGIAPTIKLVGLNQHPEWQAGEAESAGQNPCVGGVSEKDASGEWGVTFLTRPTSGKGSFGPYNTYHVNRDGSF